MTSRAQSPRDRLLPKTNTKIGDREAYATSDLVMRHPTKPDLWKIVGRMDEQIILSNGEKVRHPFGLCLLRNNADICPRQTPFR